jgi:hypothetical protein
VVARKQPIGLAPSTFCPEAKVQGFLSPGNGGNEGGVKTIEAGERLFFFAFCFELIEK